ncbi:MAG: TetR/AcrR family transcriptional regulator [Flavobacteriaceae bacterium]
MKYLEHSVRVLVHEGVYKKDPETSDLGKNIVSNSLVLIDTIGFEAFTFKKLGEKIGSNESSIYRYFENKHMLLLYLASWYWSWKEYILAFQTAEITNPFQKLKKAIEILSATRSKDDNFAHIDEVALHRVIINEYSKSYLTKEVDAENEEGYFKVYKRLVLRLQEIIVSIKPNYKYSLSLSSTVLEGILHQQFLKDHFPTITNCNEEVTAPDFFNDLVLKCLK